MRRFLTVVIVVPLLVLFVVFAVANRHFVTVSFDPFNAVDPALSVSIPLFALIIAVAILGVIAGGCATWIGQRRWRRAARRHLADAEAARAQVAQLSAAVRANQGPSQSLVPAAPARLFAPYGRDKQGAALQKAAEAGRRSESVGPGNLFRPDARSSQMSLLVKICGLTTPETLGAALDAGAEMVGFVFFPPSPRHVGLTAARELGQQAKGRALKVALTVDADDATFENIVETLRPDLLQLHGRESVARIRDLKQRFGLPVMKAIAVATTADLVPLAGYADVCDRILFDARAPKDATRPGGLGATFDWHVLDALALDRPFMVSGGLSADNVAEAVRITRAGGVDVSSGVERAPGVKDCDMIRNFIRAARAAEELSVQ